MSHSGPRTVQFVDKPLALPLVQAKSSSAVRIVLGKVPGAVTYIIQACQGDPNDVREPWRLAYSSHSLLSRNGGARLNNMVVTGDYLTYIIDA